MLAPVSGGAGERDHTAALAEPVAILEHVGQSVPVVTEMIGQRERAIELGEQRRAILGVREIGMRVLQARMPGRGLQRLDRAGPGTYAGVVDVREVGDLHSRILAKLR